MTTEQGQNETREMGEGHNVYAELENAAIAEKTALKIEPKPRWESRRGTLLLDVDPAQLVLPDFLARLEEQGYSKKDEYHMTVIGFKQGRNVARAVKANPELGPQVKGLLRQFDMGLEQTGQYIRLRKQYEGETEPRETVIERVNCPSVGELVSRISALTGVPLDVQPPHITILTKGNSQGIGINSDAEIAAFGEPIA